MATLAEKIASLAAQVDQCEQPPLEEFHASMRDGHEVEDFSSFRSLVEDLAAHPDTPLEACVGDVTRGKLAVLVNVYGSRISTVFAQFAHQQNQVRKAAAERAYLDSTVEVREWRGSTFAKPTRVRRDQLGTMLDKFMRAGHSVIEERANIRAPEDRGHDDLSVGASYKISHKAIGAELPQGTITGKRTVRQPDAGLCLQYRIKPRSAKAEAAYQKRKRIAELQSLLQLNADMLTSEQMSDIKREIDDLSA